MTAPADDVTERAIAAIDALDWTQAEFGYMPDSEEIARALAAAGLLFDGSRGSDGVRFIQHARTHTDAGPDFCPACSAYRQEWVTWEKCDNPNNERLTPSAEDEA